MIASISSTAGNSAASAVLFFDDLNTPDFDHCFAFITGGQEQLC